ncbi:MAG: metal-sensitive transcriptional regulator [Acidimicrobiales bacterium]
MPAKEATPYNETSRSQALGHDPLARGTVGGQAGEVDEVAPAHVHGYIAAGDKEALARRMHRIEGQVRGIEKMIAEDRYCIDILTQISAVSTALEAVGEKLLDDHVSHCVARALSSGDEAAATEKSRELLEAVHRFVRSR